MNLPEKLLALSRLLATHKFEGVEEAVLRRAVSTAYYAVFQLLVSATATNWGRDETRSAFGRLLDHGKMKAACEKKIAEIKKRVKATPDTADLASERKIQIVAEAFVLLHQQRTSADYDTSKEWSPTEVLSLVDEAESAFREWRLVENSREAQAFLFSFLAKDR